jgi:PilZ domain
MFEFLKDILGVPRQVTVIGYEHPEVILRSKSPLDLGVVDVMAEIADVKIKAQVQIVESGMEECRGLWIAPTEALPFLIEVFTPNEQRANPRYKRSLRVRSSRLDEYQGNSVDLSLCGMRLLGKGHFELGETIDLTFELDDARETSVATQSKVCWLAPSADEEGWLLIGLRYLDLDAQKQEASFQHYENFLNRIGASEPTL